MNHTKQNCVTRNQQWLKSGVSLVKSAISLVKSGEVWCKPGVCNHQISRSMIAWIMNKKFTTQIFFSFGLIHLPNCIEQFWLTIFFNSNFSVDFHCFTVWDFVGPISMEVKLRVISAGGLLVLGSERSWRRTPISRAMSAFYLFNVSL